MCRECAVRNSSRQCLRSGNTGAPNVQALISAVKLRRGQAVDSDEGPISNLTPSAKVKERKLTCD